MRAIGASAHMKCDVWYLELIDIILSADYMVKTMLPVHCYKWHSRSIVEKEYTISVSGFLHFQYISILNDYQKHLCHIRCNWQYSCPSILFCGFYDVSYTRCSLSIFTVLFSKLTTFSINPQNPDIRISA